MQHLVLKKLTPQAVPRHCISSDRVRIYPQFWSTPKRKMLMQLTNFCPYPMRVIQKFLSLTKKEKHILLWQQAITFNKTRKTNLDFSSFKSGSVLLQPKCSARAFLSGWSLEIFEQPFYVYMWVIIITSYLSNQSIYILSSIGGKSVAKRSAAFVLNKTTIV